MVRQRVSYKKQFIILIICFAAAFLISNLLGRYYVYPQWFADACIYKLAETADSLPGFIRDILFSGQLGEWLNSVLTGPRSWPDAVYNILFEIRIPRVAAALMIGGGLSVAGVSYQGMFRNPMVSPDILGASTGAGFGAALAILMGFGYFMISASAFVMGIAAVAMAYLFSRLSKTNETLGLILSGMIVSALFSAGTSYIKLVADTNEELPAITYWLMGSLTSIKIQDVKFLIIPFIIGIVPLIIIRWRMNLLTMDEDSARAMGVNTRFLRATVIFCATLLTASAVSVSGMIGWVGLVIPHFCRIIFGYDYRRLIPATILFGATFLIVVDDIARLATTGEIPIGILTSFVGAPLFLYLLVTGGGKRD